MFAGGFLRARFVRRILSSIAALMAFLGGALVVASSLTLGIASGAVGLLLGLGALLSAWWIFRGGRALLFPRARLSLAGFLAIAIGVILSLLGHGTEALLVVGGGLLAWVALL